MRKALFFLAAVLFSMAAHAQYPGWGQSGSVFIVTTPEGANLPTGAALENFPQLMRRGANSIN